MSTAPTSPPHDDAPAVLVETRPGVVRLTLNRPAKGNALGLTMAREVLAAIAAAEADESVHVLTLTGAGRIFCGGGDVQAMAASPAGPERRAMIQELGEAAGEVAVAQVWRDERVLAFLDHRPLFPGHTLVIPTAHVPTLVDADEPTLARVMGRARAVAAVCSPIDLAAGGWAIGRGFNRLVYTRMFLRTMKPKALQKLAQHPGLFDRDGLRAAGVVTGVATDIGGGTSWSMLQTLAEAYKVAALRGQRLHPYDAFHWATAGNAGAMQLGDRIGRIAPGYDADLVVLDSRATPEMALRMETAETLAEELFVLQIMGDDRAVTQCWVAGQPAL